MATAYGQALGLDSNGLLVALLVTQIVAFPSVLIFGRLVKKISPEKYDPDGGSCLLSSFISTEFTLSSIWRRPTDRLWDWTVTGSS